LENGKSNVMIDDISLIPLLWLKVVISF